MSTDILCEVLKTMATIDDIESIFETRYTPDKQLEVWMTNKCKIIQPPWCNELARTPVFTLGHDDTLHIPDAEYDILLTVDNADQAVRQAINYKMATHDMPCDRINFIENFWKHVG